MIVSVMAVVQWEIILALSAMRYLVEQQGMCTNHHIIVNVRVLSNFTWQHGIHSLWISSQCANHCSRCKTDQQGLAHFVMMQSRPARTGTFLESVCSVSVSVEIAEVQA